MDLLGNRTDIDNNERLEINMIDFDWVEKQTKANRLRKGLKLLEDDGGYFPDLMRCIKDRLKLVDPKYITDEQRVEIDKQNQGIAIECVDEFLLEMNK